MPVSVLSVTLQARCSLPSKYHIPGDSSLAWLTVFFTPYTGYPHLATETYLPIRVIAPVRAACQSHSSGICIPAGCTQDKVPRPAIPCTSGHSEEDLGKKKDNCNLKDM